MLINGGKIQGLPPSLSRAIDSISRLKLVEACLPHVLHCGAVLLEKSLTGEELFVLLRLNDVLVEIARLDALSLFCPKFVRQFINLQFIVFIIFFLLF